MRRLAEWIHTEGFTFAAATAVLALVSGLGGFWAGRVWIDRYITEHERSGAVSTLPQPSQVSVGGAVTPADLSPRVVIREREPTEAERRAVLGGTGQSLSDQTGTTSPAGEAAEQSGDSAEASPEMPNTPEASQSAGTVGTAPSGVEQGQASGDSWAATAGSYREPRNAEQVAATLREQGFDVEIQPVTVRGETFYRVRVGAFASKAEAEAAARRIEAAGYPSQVVAEP
ncbi:MAG: SPOR domain-containing protein [Armatimonadetes bacterium]|nr:SPOR domain-containing protein [Armatimonadota bacterium]